MKLSGKLTSVEIIEKSGVDFYLKISIESKDEYIVQATRQMTDLLIKKKEQELVIWGHTFKTMIKGSYLEFVNITALEYGGERLEMVVWHGIVRLVLLGVIMYFSAIYSSFIAGHIHDVTGFSVLFIKAFLFISLAAFCFYSKTMTPFRMALKLLSSMIHLKFRRPVKK